MAIADRFKMSLATNTYDEYGIPGSSNSGRFQYTGQVWLPELGLYYYKARFYSPTLGRFLQTDPIGYASGSNLYACVGNDPINFVDPLGLDEAVRDPNEIEVVGTRLPKCHGCGTPPPPYGSSLTGGTGSSNGGSSEGGEGFSRNDRDDDETPEERRRRLIEEERLRVLRNACANLRIQAFRNDLLGSAGSILGVGAIDVVSGGKFIITRGSAIVALGSALYSGYAATTGDPQCS
jgi:RHS repeat-associated protein